jgi:hypothetical protein
MHYTFKKDDDKWSVESTKNQVEKWMNADDYLNQRQLFNVQFVDTVIHCFAIWIGPHKWLTHPDLNYLKLWCNCRLVVEHVAWFMVPIM